MQEETNRFQPADGVKMADLLQYQTRLFKKSVISSDTPDTWRTQVKGLLSEAAPVIGVLFLYVVLPHEDERWDCEFFWTNDPAPALRAATTALLEQTLEDGRDSGDIRRYNVVHTVVNALTPMPPATSPDVDLRSRRFPLKTTEESGIAGMGLSREKPLYPEDEIAIDNTLTAFVGFISVLAALNAHKLEIERFATRDQLTNLYNQKSFWDRLEDETNRAKRQQYQFSLLIIDIDNFKTINDTYGHETGDSYLRDFAGILKGAVRSGDIAARYAGDQFAAILPLCDEGQAHSVAKRIVDGIREYYCPLIGEASIRGTVSVGVAVYPDHARAAKDLFLLAGNMLSQAKSFGKDRISMPSEQDDVESLKIMGGKSILILEALANRRITPYFQPIMHAKDRTVEAFEVLTRIVHSDRVIPAAEFIDTAEGMGVVGRIDYQLFEHALAKVRDTKYTGNLFINLSPRALMLRDFMTTIRRMMRDYGFEPTKLIFEITERDTVKNVRLINGFILDLKQEGFRFAVDDFGSGYSSFQYIKTFSVDFLKIDGEFIRNLTGEDSVEKHIVASIAALAKRLGIKTVAEYVETEETMREVQAAGIDYAQGYFVRRPSPNLFL